MVTALAHTLIFRTANQCPSWPVGGGARAGMIDGAGSRGRMGAGNGQICRFP
jgi:hypothetical protein